MVWTVCRADGRAFWQKMQRIGHTGARTQDHSVISTALYRLSYTTSLRTTSLNKITKLHTAYLQRKLLPYAHAHSQLNTATTINDLLCREHEHTQLAINARTTPNTSGLSVPPPLQIQIHLHGPLNCTSSISISISTQLTTCSLDVSVDAIRTHSVFII